MIKLLLEKVYEQGIVNIILQYKLQFEYLEKRKICLNQLISNDFQRDYIYIDFNYRDTLFKPFEITQFLGDRKIEDLSNEEKQEYDEFIYELDLTIVHEPNMLWDINYENSSKSLCIYEFDDVIRTQRMSSIHRNRNIENNMDEYELIIDFNDEDT